MKTLNPIDPQCVVVGSLNPGIIQPEWLSSQSVIEEEPAEWELELQVGAPTPSFHDAHLRWQCKYDRLVVTSLDGTDPGSAVARVFELLHHTPLRAVGNNFSFLIHEESERKALAARTESRAVAWLSELGYHASAYATTLQIGVNDARLNLKIEHSDQGAHAVSFNFHRSAPNSAVAVKAARMWADDGALASSLLGKLVQSEG